MVSCCAAEVTTVPEARRCAACQTLGRAVDIVTLRALLRPRALERLKTGEYSFCPTASCPVVFFSETEAFRTEDVAVPVYQKLPEGRRIVCYCFDVVEDEIRGEVEETGVSSSAERIKALVRDRRCACDVRNPQGSCCLGNVAALIKAARADEPVSRGV